MAKCIVVIRPQEIPIEAFSRVVDGFVELLTSEDGAPDVQHRGVDDVLITNEPYAIEIMNVRGRSKYQFWMPAWDCDRLEVELKKAVAQLDAQILEPIRYAKKTRQHIRIITFAGIAVALWMLVARDRLPMEAAGIMVGVAAAIGTAVNGWYK